jgi:pyruvate kinase
MSTSLLEFISASLKELEEKMHHEANSRAALLESLHPAQQMAGRNLLHYLAMRNHDIRQLQDALHICGFSSLASSESHALRQLQAIRERLHEDVPNPDTCTFEAGKEDIDLKSRLLFGDKPEGFLPAIMVTFDSHFADDYALIKSLLQNGMNVARINCAHDDEATWAKMINKLRKACYHTGRHCRIYMDLGGPKFRTELLCKGAKKGKVKVKEGDMIWLAKTNEGFEKTDVVINPGEIILPGKLKKGERVYIDDGIIRAVIEKVKDNRIGARITRISSDKKMIKSEKGVNFPDSEIEIDALTQYDIACLPFICDNADLVGYSFVKNAEDIAMLRSQLRAFSEKPPHIVLKIETPDAVRNLPSLLFAAMQDEVFGVMIARGDLAVEIGFERMVEIQDEILWLCEAAHAPVIWATQVLENMNKSGMATRSEITDAGHAALAECIMLNKGGYTVEVMESLKDILHRTCEHRIKKRYTLRPLRIAQHYLKS